MSKRIITAIAALMIMILAGTAAVYAIGARPEENSADAGTGADIINQDALPAEEAPQLEPVNEIDFSLMCLLEQERGLY